MLSKILYIPFIICSLGFLYLAWEEDSRYGMYMVPFVIALVVIYLLSPQINWWWYQRYPPKLPDGVVKLFATRLPFFQQLAPADKTTFCHRVALYMEANEFIPKGMPSVPVDVKAVIAASVVWLTFGRKDFLLNKFEHIVVYPHPFPSPQFQQWHASEIYEPDGVIMFSAEQLMAGFVQPTRFFPVGLYEYVRVFRRCYPGISFPVAGEDIWQALQTTSGFSREALEKWFGLKELDAVAAATVCFFVFPDKFKMLLPGWADRLERIFREGDLFPES